MCVQVFTIPYNKKMLVYGESHYQIMQAHVTFVCVLRKLIRKIPLIVK